jgi:endonuclease/exonuclease/phosphatase family metal-dependent hydrolase
VSPLELTVFSLNLRFGLADDGPNGWHYRKPFFPLLLNQYPSDFYAFQEVNDFQARDLQAFLSDYHFIGQRRSAPAYWQNNLIFYHRNWQCSEQYHFYLSRTPNIPSKFDDSKWPRQCTMGVFQQANRQVLCVNTHFDFTEKVQEKSARLILSRLSTRSVTEPTIIMGDFNTSPNSQCYRIFTEKTGFKNTFQPPFPSTHHGFTGKTDGETIDWILYRGPIIPDNSEVLLDDFDGRYPSDHFPLHVRFQWAD